MRGPGKPRLSQVGPVQNLEETQHIAKPWASDELWHMHGCKGMRFCTIARQVIRQARNGQDSMSSGVLQHATPAKH